MVGTRMLRNLKLPEVKPLNAQLLKFYEMNKLSVSDEQLLREAWGFKAACGFVKRKGRRGELTKEPWLQTLNAGTCKLKATIGPNYQMFHARYLFMF